MGKWEKLRQKILVSGADADVRFDDICHLLRRHGFRERIKGSHHIFTMPGVDEILNLQPKGGGAKAYQVAQVRDLILKHRLGDRSDD